MRKNVLMACGVVFFCCFVHAAEKIEVINFSKSPDAFSEDIKKLRPKIREEFLKNTKKKWLKYSDERTMFIYTCFYNQFHGEDSKWAKDVQGRFNFEKNKEEFQSLLEGIRFSENTLYRVLTTEQKERYLSLMAHHEIFYTPAWQYLKPDEFIAYLTLNEKALRELRKLEENDLEKTPFMQMARIYYNFDCEFPVRVTKKWINELLAFFDFAEGLQRIADGI